MERSQHLPFRLRIREELRTGEVAYDREPHGIREASDGCLLALVPSAVEYEPQDAPPGIDVPQSAEDVVRCEQGHELPRCDDEDRIGVPRSRRYGKASAHHVPENIAHTVIRFDIRDPGEEELHPLTGTPLPRIRSPAFNACDAVDPVADGIRGCVG